VSTTTTQTARAALLTVFTSSLAIMLVQLVAGRLAAAYIGQSLYTWTSIIGVTLAGIALGNILGGRAADRSHSARTLGLLLILAGLAEAAILLLNPLAGNLGLLQALSWPVRIALHTTIVFLPAFTVLGTISPVVARRVLASGGNTGGGVGSLFAWSIGGSLLGTFLTGYYLLAVLGNREILALSALVLVAVGAAHIALARRLDAGLPMEAARAEGEPAPAPIPWRAAVVVLLTGVCVMALELAAGRMLGRIYGSSLFVWTNTIGVILAALSLGGVLGGRMADRLGGARATAVSLVVAAALTALAPLLNTLLHRYPILWDFPWPVQIFLHTVIVFFPPCLLMGAATPAAIRVVLEASQVSGRTIGRLYALNALGSIAGTFLAGYFLIATLGTVATVCVVFVGLTLAGLLLLPRHPLTLGWGLIALFLALSAFVPFGPFPAAGLNLGLRPYTEPLTVYERESQYSYVAVTQIDREQPNIRSFILDKLVHSKADITQPEDLRYSYLAYFTALLDEVYGPQTPLHTLTVGGGGYSLPHYLEVNRPGGITDVVEIDPAVTEAAHAAFGFPRDTTANIFHMDGRNYVVQTAAATPPGGGKYDVVLCDSVSDYSVPFHLTTVEYLRDIAAILKEDGVYAGLLIDMYDIGGMLSASIGTAQAVFPHVTVICCGGRLDRRSTYVIVGSRRPLDLSGVPARAAHTPEGKGRLLTAEEIAALRARTGNTLLSDNFAPVENLLAPVVWRTEESVLIRRLLRADTFLAEGAIDAAIREAEIVVKSGRDFPEAYEVLANALVQQGNATRAVDMLKQATERWPDRAALQEKLAAALFNARRPEEALQYWRRALALEPRLAVAHRDLGAALVQMGRLEEAEPHLREAIAIEPAHIGGHMNLAGLYYQREDFAGAVRALEAAAKLGPPNPALQEQIAVASFRAKQFDAAWAAVNAARAAGGEVNPAFLRDLQRESGRQQ